MIDLGLVPQYAHILFRKIFCFKYRGGYIDENKHTVFHCHSSGPKQYTSNSESLWAAFYALAILGNYISEIEGLEGLQFLQQLVLDHNHIKMISQGFIARQNGLLTLHLEQNKIWELNSLQPLVKLQKLFLDFNRMQV